MTKEAQNETLDDPDSVQTLWRIGLEVLGSSVKTWRTYGNRNKEQRIRLGLSIARVAMEMLDRHPDLQEVREAREKMQQLLTEVQSR